MFAALRALPTAPAPPSRRLLVWLISATNIQDHAVPLEEMEAGFAAGPGHLPCDVRGFIAQLARMPQK
ncbi:MAG: hypothetical protein ACRDRH_17780 [Pseudonocardia sp.]